MLSSVPESPVFGGDFMANPVAHRPEIQVEKELDWRAVSAGYEHPSQLEGQAVKQSTSHILLYHKIISYTTLSLYY